MTGRLNIVTVLMITAGVVMMYGAYNNQPPWNVVTSALGLTEATKYCVPITPTMPGRNLPTTTTLAPTPNTPIQPSPWPGLPVFNV